MNIVDVMETLYRSHLDCGIESYQGYGFIAWVVDERNRRVERRFKSHELEAVGDWLLSEASRRLGSKEDGDSSNARSILAELSEAQRKDPKRVESRDRAAAADQANRVS